MIYPRDVGGLVFAALLLAAPFFIVGYEIGRYFGWLN